MRVRGQVEDHLGVGHGHEVVLRQQLNGVEEALPVFRVVAREGNDSVRPSLGVEVDPEEEADVRRLVQGVDLLVDQHLTRVKAGDVRWL